MHVVSSKFPTRAVSTPLQGLEARPEHSYLLKTTNKQKQQQKKQKQTKTTWFNHPPPKNSFIHKMNSRSNTSKQFNPSTLLKCFLSP